MDAAGLALKVVVELCRRGGWRRRGGKRWWERHPPGRLRFGPGSEGEELLAYLDGPDAPGARASALAWLGFADRLLEDGPPPADLPLRFDRWTAGEGAALLDALVDELRAVWADARRGGEVIDAFMDAADRAGRRDLAALVLGRAPLARGRLAIWIDEARAVRFFDDGYDAAQRLLAAVEGRS